MVDPQDLGQRLLEARHKGDPDELAEALAVHANALVLRGEVARARLELDEAAAIHLARGRTLDLARLSLLTASLCRLEGRLDEAKARAEQAVRLAGAESKIVVAADTELGEIALTGRDGVSALDAFSRGLTGGEAAGLSDAGRAALLRKRASALVLVERAREAVNDLATAHTLLLHIGDAPAAVRAQIEQATVLQQLEDWEEATRIRLEAMRMAEQTGDSLARSDLSLLEAGQAVMQHDCDAARVAAERARTHALEASAPVQYLSAAIALAQIEERRGDRLAAYEALAVGWATLGDLLGRDTARSIFEPRLLELRSRWGTDAFADTKLAYEARRRARN